MCSKWKKVIVETDETCFREFDGASSVRCLNKLLLTTMINQLLAAVININANFLSEILANGSNNVISIVWIQAIF